MTNKQYDPCGNEIKPGDPDYRPLHKPELILIRGLPGSGKTTKAHEMVKQMAMHDVDAVVCEADDYFLGDDGEYRYDPLKTKEARDFCYLKASYALQRGKTAIISNTFTRLWEMEAYYRLASSMGLNVTVIVTRGEWPSIHNVPQEIIERMRARWED